MRTNIQPREFTQLDRLVKRLQDSGNRGDLNAAFDLLRGEDLIIACGAIKKAFNVQEWVFNAAFQRWYNS